LQVLSKYGLEDCEILYRELVEHLGLYA
jgi:hypothetical protein